MLSLHKLAAASALTILFSLPAAALPIYGNFDFSGGQAFLSSAGVDFLPLGGGNGIFTISNPVSAAFTGMAGTGGTIGDLLTANGRVPGVALNDSGFIAIAGQPTWNFVLRYITPGAQGWYTLTQVGGSVIAGIELSGIAINTATLEESGWVASLTTQFTSTTVAAIQQIILGGNAPQNSWSGTFTTAPEPGSALTLLSGLALAGLGIYRRRS